jgi:hypothetical protein
MEQKFDEAVTALTAYLQQHGMFGTLALLNVAGQIMDAKGIETTDELDDWGKKTCQALLDSEENGENLDAG